MIEKWFSGLLITNDACNVVDAGARRMPHMADIERGAVDPDLAATGAIDMGDLLGIRRDWHDDPVRF